MEFLEGLRHAGISLDIVSVESDRRFWVRIARRLNSSPYLKPIRAKDLERIRQRLPNVDVLLLNQVALAGALDQLGPLDIGPARILLSHGCEITDMVHLARLRHRLPVSVRLRPTVSMALATALAAEFRTRSLIDGVIGISPFDAACEEWLGSPRVIWIPRTTKSEALEWSPKMGRFGYVGTLDHAPNLEGLIEVLQAMEKRQANELTLRIVGGPARIGRELAKRYRAADYLGQLDDASLSNEASSWIAFLHPIFCLPRGCSTKLATALAWRIPVITTRHGRRGYVWRRGALIEVNSADEFVVEMKALLNVVSARAAQAQVIEVAESTPSIEEIAKTLGDFLCDVASATSSRRRS